MDYLYSLYDALVSINVPNDKARAVVDAMERDMATTIATKTDLQVLRQELVSQLTRLATNDEMQSVKGEIALVRKDMQILAERIAMMSTNVTMRLGSMMVALIGLLFAALKLS